MLPCFPGIANVLNRIPHFDYLDLEDSVEYLEDPYEFTVTYPFGHHEVAHESEEEDEQPRPGPSGNNKRKAAAPKAKKGRNPAHSVKMRKYGHKNMPVFLKKLIISHWPLSEIMNRKKWAKVFLKLESCSLAASTWKKYISALNAFKIFGNENQIPLCWPITDEQKLGFIVWCHQARNLSSSTVKSYLTSLNTLNHMVIFPSAKGGEENLTKILLRGIEHSQYTEPKTAIKSDPLTFAILKKLRKLVKNKSWKKLSKKTVWAACCVGYFGSFRAGELLAKAQWSFDKFSDLLWTDIIDEGKKSIKIHVKCPKTGGRGGEFIELFPTPDPKVDPVKAIRKIKVMQKTLGIWNKNLPVFRFGSGKNLTVAKLSQILRKLFIKTKFASLRITAKSMRAGIPTDMESHPSLINDTHIKIWGRWKGKSYLRYMKAPPVSRKWIFDKICAALFT